MSEGRQLMLQGRIIWTVGKTPFDGAQRKDQTGRPITNAQGEPAMQYGFGLAVPKPGPASTPDEVKNFMDMWNAIQSEAMALYPTGQIPPGFSFKYKDGDGVDHKGMPFSSREGYAGHLVYALTTSLPLKFFKYEGGAYVQVKDGIKCGDYVQVQVNVKGHLPKPGTQGKPGLYLNPNMTLFLGFGKEIVNAPDASSVFGAAPPPMPTGASATPVGGPANFGTFGQQPEMGQQAPQTPQWGGQANPNVLPPQFQTQPQPAPPVMSPNQGYANPQTNYGGPTQPGPTAPQTAFPSNGAPTPRLPWQQ